MCLKCRESFILEGECFTRALIKKARATGRSIDDLYENWRSRSASDTGSEPTSPSYSQSNVMPYRRFKR